MIKKREFGFILMAILIMAFVISLTNLNIDWVDFGYALIYSSLIIFTAVLSKHFIAHVLHIKIEHKTWKLTRFWITRKRHLKHPIPLGLILPLILSIISAGFIKCFTLLQFDSQALPSKVTKQIGNKRFAEIMEWDLAVIGFFGILGVIILSIIANLLNIPELARFAVYYCIWNLVPFGQLDGLKILMGSPGLGASTKVFAPLYLLSWIITLITLVIVLF